MTYTIEQMNELRDKLTCQANKIEAAFGKAFIPADLIKEIEAINTSIEAKEIEEKAAKKADELVEKIMFNAGMVRSTDSHHKWLLKDIEIPFCCITETEGTYEVLKVYGLWYVDDDMHKHLRRPLFSVTISGSEFVQYPVDELVSVAEKESNKTEKYFNSAAIRYAYTTLHRVLTAMGFNQHADTKVTVS